MHKSHTQSIFIFTNWHAHTLPVQSSRNLPPEPGFFSRLSRGFPSTFPSQSAQNPVGAINQTPHSVESATRLSFFLFCFSFSNLIDQPNHFASTSKQQLSFGAEKSLQGKQRRVSFPFSDRKLQFRLGAMENIHAHTHRQTHARTVAHC